MKITCRVLQSDKQARIAVEEAREEEEVKKLGEALTLLATGPHSKSGGGGDLEASGSGDGCGVEFNLARLEPWIYTHAHISYHTYVYITLVASTTIRSKRTPSSWTLR